MAGKIKKMIDLIIQEMSMDNPAIEEMTKAKFILKGLSPDKFDRNSEDDPKIIKKLLSIDRNIRDSYINTRKGNMKSIWSNKPSEEEAVKEIRRQLGDFSPKIIIFFASSNYDQDKVSSIMQDTFTESIVFGCSTAGEIADGRLVNNSITAMAFNSNIISDAKVEVIDLMDEKRNIENAFSSFEHYFNESAYRMDTKRYVGIVLMDGMSMKEEKVMDVIGNRTNVVFVGGSAGDDLKYEKTFVYANGKAYTNSALLVLFYLSENGEFSIIKTQSFKILDKVLIANKVNEETREVIEFNNKPAILAYADAVGAASAEEAPKYFSTHPVGLVIDENDIFVRSPRQVMGTSIKFYCNLIEGMEAQVLEATNIIEDTRKALQQKLDEFKSIDGILNFNCIERTLELEKKNQTKLFQEIFSNVPTVGFSTYGEAYIGHTNQTSIMLAFKLNRSKALFNSDIIEKEHDADFKEIEYLKKVIAEKDQQLEETTSALKEFNKMLEDEIAERTKREGVISYLSYHDKLTGLYNRRFYEEEIKKIDNKRNLPISIIMGDVNNLKLVNDVFGHEKGDELLIKVSKGIQHICRKNDCAARWGGDEFVILLPKTSSEEAEDIVKRINAQYFKEQVGNIQVSVSFGWETKKNPEDDIMKILKRAENYMYEHKIIESKALKNKVIGIINNTLFEKNKLEEQHSKRVGELCQKLGAAIGLTEVETIELKTAGVLHDIGKIVLEDKLLMKAEKLNEQEWNAIKCHSDTGYQIVNSCFNLQDLANGILSHHERWDGKGYPTGLKGDEIPLTARIIALADSYDSMISDKPYRKALSKEEAIAEIRDNAGTQFEPEIAKIFIEKVLGEK
ncbi:MAG: FIST N-terminal domain-containing protein [Solirubrobacterales bacterium]